MDGDNLFADVLARDEEITMLTVALNDIRKQLGDEGKEFFSHLKTDFGGRSVIQYLRYLDVIGAEISFCIQVANMAVGSKSTREIAEYIQWFDTQDRSSRFITANAADLVSTLPRILNAIYGGVHLYPGDPEEDVALLWRVIRAKIINEMHLSDGMRLMADSTAIILVSSMVDPARCIELSHRVLPYLSKNVGGQLVAAAEKSRRPEEFLAHAFWLLVFDINLGNVSTSKCGIVWEVSQALLDMGGEQMRQLIGAWKDIVEPEGANEQSAKAA